MIIILGVIYYIGKAEFTWHHKNSWTSLTWLVFLRDARMKWKGGREGRREGGREGKKRKVERHFSVGIETFFSKWFFFLILKKKERKKQRLYINVQSFNNENELILNVFPNKLRN